LPAMQQKVPGITLEKADQGFVLYKNKCAGCHRLHAPSEHTANKWEKTLIAMYPKAKVSSGKEQKLIRDYLISLSE
jgi:cytochrome c1